MVSAMVYRGEAKRCRASAAAAHDSEAAARWLRIAKDYDQLADAIVAEEARYGAPPVMHTPIQQQPMQQQQSKAKRPE
jgi:hypothetical protein